MPAEIERKFLVDAGWIARDVGTLIRQGYLSSIPERTVRVRTRGDDAYLTVKGKTVGVTRSEFEYPIPITDAEALLSLCEQPLIEKRRHVEGRFEIDVFLGANAGLVVAEIELGDDTEVFDRPAWLRAEVSEDPRYFNSNLVANPFSRW